MESDAGLEKIFDMELEGGLLILYCLLHLTEFLLQDGNATMKEQGVLCELEVSVPLPK